MISRALFLIPDLHLYLLLQLIADFKLSDVGSTCSFIQPSSRQVDVAEVRKCSGLNERSHALNFDCATQSIYIYCIATTSINVVYQSCRSISRLPFGKNLCINCPTWFQVLVYISLKQTYLYFPLLTPLNKSEPLQGECTMLHALKIMSAVEEYDYSNIKELCSSGRICPATSISCLSSIRS